MHTLSIPDSCQLTILIRTLSRRVLYLTFLLLVLTACHESAKYPDAGQEPQEEVLVDSFESLIMGQIKSKFDAAPDSLEMEKGSLRFRQLGNFLRLLRNQQYKAALDVYHQLPDNIAESLSPEAKSEWFRLMGSLFYGNNKLEEAAKNYLESLRISEQQKDSIGMSATLNNLGSVYYRIGDLDISLEYFDKSADLKLQIGDSIGLARVYNNMSNIHGDKGSHLLSLQYTLQSIKIKELKQPAGTLGGAYNNAAISLKNLKRYSEAEQYALKAYTEDSLANDSSGMAYVLNALADIAYQKGDLNQALLYSVQSLELANRLQLYPLLHPGYETRALIFESKGQLRDAIKALKLSQQFKDSLINSEKNNTILELQEQYEAEKKESEISRLTAKQQIQELEAKKAAQTRVVLLILITLITLIAILTYLFLRNRTKRNELLRKNNQTLEELNELKDRLFITISHDLKGSISSFTKITDVLLKHRSKLDPEQITYYLESLNSAGLNVSFTLSNLLSWSRSQKGLLASVKYHSVNEIIRECISHLSVQMAGRAIQVRYDLKLSDDLNLPSENLRVILRNIVSNAVKFSPEHGKIEIESGINDEQIVIRVSDEGEGVSQEVQDFINGDTNAFGALNSNEGHGLGLILVKENIAQLNGKIRVISGERKGSIFEIRIPLSKTTSNIIV